MTHKYRLTVETLAAGQPRAYADSRYELLVTGESHFFGDERGWEPMNASLLEKKARAVTQADRLKDGADLGREWHESYVDAVEVRGPGQVFIRTITPFCD